MYARTGEQDPTHGVHRGLCSGSGVEGKVRRDWCAPMSQLILVP